VGQPFQHDPQREAYGLSVTAVGFAIWTVFSFGFSWLVSRGDDKRERTERFLWLFVILMGLAVIVVLSKYFWPGAHDPDSDYR
jgi:drug/metabolite transporter (DMT)-like permease